MQFDKSRVYTALNADELKIGSKVILADRLSLLKRWVKNDDKPSVLYAVTTEEDTYRFASEEDGERRALACLIAQPAEPKYKPFPDNAMALKIIAKHGGWVKNAEGFWLITNLTVGNEDEEGIYVCDSWHSAKHVLNRFTFADDGSPVGVKIDDDADADGNEEA